MKLQVGVKALIQDERGSYLFVQRTDPLPDGTGIRWDVPGGRIKAEEKLFDALKREVKEEVGMELYGELQLCAAQDIMLPAMQVHVVRLTYIARARGTVQLSVQHQTFQWLSLGAALELPLDRYLREVLQALVR